MKGREYTESRIDWNRQSYSKVMWPFVASRFGHWMFFDVDFGSELGFRSLGGAIPPPNAPAGWGPWTLRQRVFLTKTSKKRKHVFVEDLILSFDDGIFLSTVVTMTRLLFSFLTLQ